MSKGNWKNTQRIAVPNFKFVEEKSFSEIHVVAFNSDGFCAATVDGISIGMNLKSMPNKL